MKRAAFFAFLTAGTVFSIAYTLICWVVAGDSFTAAEEDASRGEAGWHVDNLGRPAYSFEHPPAFAPRVAP